MNQVEKKAIGAFAIALIIYIPLSVWNIFVSAERIMRENNPGFSGSLQSYQRTSSMVGVLGTVIFIVVAFFIYRIVYKSINKDNGYMIERFKEIFFFNMAALYIGGSAVTLLNRFLLSNLDMPVLPIALGIKLLLLVSLNTALIKGEGNRPIANTALFSVLALF